MTRRDPKRQLLLFIVLMTGIIVSISIIGLVVIKAMHVAGV